MISEQIFNQKLDITLPSPPHIPRARKSFYKKVHSRRTITEDP